MQRHGHCQCGFLRSHATEIPHLDQLCLPLIRFFKALQCVVQSEYGTVGLWIPVRQLTNGNLQLSAALLRGSGASCFHKNLPHQTGRYPVEVSAVLERRLTPSCQFQKRFVDQSRSLQRTRFYLPPQMRSRQFLQFLVNQRYQRVHRIAIAGLEPVETFCELHKYERAIAKRLSSFTAISDRYMSAGARQRWS